MEKVKLNYAPREDPLLDIYISLTYLISECLKDYEIYEKQLDHVKCFKIKMDIEHYKMRIDELLAIKGFPWVTQNT